MIRRLAVAASLLLCLAALPAHAFPGGPGGGWLQVQQRPHPQRERQYQQPQREQQFQPQPRRYEEPQAPQGPQRMSPDERRQLRRDLHDANRDIYPQRRDWRR